MANAGKVLPDLERIRKEAAAPRRERLRIVIAGDAGRPIRSISLPRGLPKVVSIIAITLVLATGVLIALSSHMNGSLARL